jgi:hypothetical protein
LVAQLPVHVPPQPSAAPPHFPLQLGVHAGFTVTLWNDDVGCPVTESARHCTLTDDSQPDGTVGLQVAVPLEFAVVDCEAMMLPPCVTKNATVPLAPALPRLHVKVTPDPTVAGFGATPSVGLIVTQLWLGAVNK